MKTVYVGLSGGVDSAVSAALLKERGYDVVGAFIKIWRPEFTECTWKEDRIDAMRVAAALQIPFREIDLSDEYKREVVDTMVRDYAQGITPNPDVLCNKVIKFGSFYRWAREQGTDIVATGHYARINPRGDASRMSLWRSKDIKKDQSYFLHQIKGEHLERVLFPVGEYEKTEIRSLAKKLDLPNATRPDSQGLCFVGDISLPAFLSRFIPLIEGDVVDMAGKVIGKHDGAPLYTIGQRHGFTAQSDVPLYVVAIDTKSNTVRVSPDKQGAAVKKVSVRDLHWIREPANGELFAQTRYREKPVRVSVDNSEVRFEEPHMLARGQSIVFYQGDECLGGGILE